VVSLAGAVSGVPGLPVDAAATSLARAERAIRAPLAEYRGEHSAAAASVSRERSSATVASSSDDDATVERAS
jgi:hypothetical protein